MAITIEALPAEPAERVRAILEQVADALDVRGEIGVDENEDRILGTIDAEDVGLLIGRRGQTIDAVQLLCYRAAFHGLHERKRVAVDAAGYRQRRRDMVCTARPITPPSARSSGSRLVLGSR